MVIHNLRLVSYMLESMFNQSFYQLFIHESSYFFYLLYCDRVKKYVQPFEFIAEIVAFV
jgi:hypothetical protein